MNKDYYYYYYFIIIIISARVWNEIVTKIIMDQHVSISKFKTMLKSYLLDS